MGNEKVEERLIYSGFEVKCHVIFPLFPPEYPKFVFDLGFMREWPGNDGKNMGDIFRDAVNESERLQKLLLPKMIIRISLD